MTKDSRLRIGIFGGSFDPPHVAHSQLVTITKNQFNLDRIYVVPSKFPPGKEPGATFEKRLEWTAEVFGQNPDLVISDLEGKSQTTVFGREIFNQLSLLEPSAQFFWILGEDQLQRLSFWKEIDSYAAKLIWLVTPRSSGHYPSGLSSKRLGQSTCSYYWTKMAPMLEVASHTIRESLIAEGEKSPQIQWIPEMIRKDVLETYSKKQGSRR